MILTEIFGHEIIDFEFKKFLPTTVPKNRETIFRCPSNITDL